MLGCEGFVSQSIVDKLESDQDHCVLPTCKYC